VKIDLIKFCALGICIAASAAMNAQDKTYIRLTTNDGQVLQGEALSKPGWFEVKDFSFDVVQTLNIGSQSSGAGAGKIAFNPFSFSMAPGRLDPKLFELAASGTPFKTMEVEVDRQAGVLEQFTFKLVAVKSVGWSIQSTSGELRIQVAMEYGGLIVNVPQKGGAAAIGGWDRVKNAAISQ
jgi:type VI protein secretion system component Hcp